jgi:inorganic triphosphatase YgiF
MIIETEMKLTLSPQEAEKLPRLPWLNELCQEPAKEEHLYTVYYDTPDQTLLTHGFVLRVRKKATGYAQVIKRVARQGKGEGMHVRAEWPTHVDSLAPDLSAIPDAALRQQLTARDDIKSVFTTDFQRHSWLVALSPGSLIELALDRGQVCAGQRCEPICEVELELLEGEESILHDLAKRLSASLMVRPENQSKALRGYRLAFGNEAASEQVR